MESGLEKGGVEKKEGKQERGWLNELERGEREKNGNGKNISGYGCCCCFFFFFFWDEELMEQLVRGAFFLLKIGFDSPELPPPSLVWGGNPFSVLFFFFFFFLPHLTTALNQKEYTYTDLGKK